MSSASKKSGGNMGISQKSESNSLSGGPGGNGGGSVVSKGDALTTTPSKSGKNSFSKKQGGNGATPNSKLNNSGVGGGGGDMNPAILNQQALEALYSATYVEDFIDCNDNMGDDLIRQTTRMFEMGSNYMTYIRELESAMAILLGEEDADHIIPDQLSSDKKKAVFRLQNVLMTAQDTGDDSLQVMQGIQDHIENKTRQLDVDRKNFAEFCKGQDTPETPFKDPPPPPTERNIKRARRNRHEIYRPSILGPSSLKATSYPENNVTSRESEGHVTTPSRSRGGGAAKEDKNLGGNTPTSSSTPSDAHINSSPAVSSSSTSANNGQAALVSAIKVEEGSSGSNEDTAPPPQKVNGRTSERSTGQTTRSSSTQAQQNDGSSSEKRSSSSYNSSTSTKKQSLKSQAQEKKTKKRKAKQSGSSSNRKEDNSPQFSGIDPDEPTYCLCDQVSYGEMICCDNNLCPIEWFHFSCVSLNTKPKGKWFCPNCRAEKPNVMKPKAVFLKELEKYNREKEEKA